MNRVVSIFCDNFQGLVCQTNVGNDPFVAHQYEDIYTHVLLDRIIGI